MLPCGFEPGLNLNPLEIWSLAAKRLDLIIDKTTLAFWNEPRAFDLALYWPWSLALNLDLASRDLNCNFKSLKIIQNANPILMLIIIIKAGQKTLGLLLNSSATKARSTCTQQRAVDNSSNLFKSGTRYGW